MISESDLRWPVWNFFGGMLYKRNEICLPMLICIALGLTLWLFAGESATKLALGPDL